MFLCRWRPRSGERLRFGSTVSLVAGQPKSMSRRLVSTAAEHAEARCWWKWATTVESRPATAAVVTPQSLSSRRSASATSAGVASSPGWIPSASARARTVRVDGAVRPVSRRVIVNACTPDRRASSACEKKCSRRKRRSLSLNAIWTSRTQCGIVNHRCTTMCAHCCIEVRTMLAAADRLSRTERAN
jgi:hypothetical protein